MAIFKFNTNLFYCVFFNALFTAVTFATILVFSKVDDYLEKQHYFNKDTSLC